MFKSQYLAALPFCCALAFPAAAFEESAISLKKLPDGSIIEYESSFCEVAIGESVSVLLIGNSGDAAEAKIVAAYVKPHAGATPRKGKAKDSPHGAYVTAVIGMEGRVVDIALDEAEPGWTSIHLQVEISSGDKLGVNLHSTPCEKGAAAI